MPQIADYLIDPVGFAKGILGLRLYDWQESVLMDLNLPGSIALRAANNSGKTSVIGASIALWNACVHPGSLTVATAGVFRQIEGQLFPALRRFAGRFPGAVFNSSDITLANNSRIIGFSADDPGRAEGWHSEDLLFIVDEAKSVADVIFEAVERCQPTRLLLMSTPGAPSGYFYECFTSRRQFYKTHVVPAGLCPHIKQSWIDEQIAKFGPDSPLVCSMIHAEWMRMSDDTVIPLTFVERCIGNPPPFQDDSTVSAFCDFASGGDENCLAVRRGNRTEIVAAWREKDTMKTVGRFIQLFREQKLEAYQIAADEGGLGRPIIDRFAENGWHVRRVNNGSPARKPDAYANLGAEIWFEARTQIERGQIILPDDNELIAQLTARRGWPDSKGRLALESKQDLRSRGVSSPDRADALLGCMAKFSSGFTREMLSQVVLGPSVRPLVRVPVFRPRRLF
jgi:hypothetical protein